MRLPATPLLLLRDTFPGSFWACIKLKIIWTFQFKAWSRTAHHYLYFSADVLPWHFWSGLTWCDASWVCYISYLSSCQHAAGLWNMKVTDRTSDSIQRWTHVGLSLNVRFVYEKKSKNDSTTYLDFLSNLYQLIETFSVWIWTQWQRWDSWDFKVSEQTYRVGLHLHQVVKDTSDRKVLKEEEKSNQTSPAAQFISENDYKTVDRVQFVHLSWALSCWHISHHQQENLPHNHSQVSHVQTLISCCFLWLGLFWRWRKQQRSRRWIKSENWPL